MLSHYMLVYRVEDDIGRGVYYCGAGPKYRAGAHPAPCHEYGTELYLHLDYISGIYSFGFRSREQLLDWFTPSDLVMVHLNDLFVSIYRVDAVHTIHGRKQVVFIRQQAVLVRKFRAFDFTNHTILEEDLLNELPKVV